MTKLSKAVFTVAGLGYTVFACDQSHAQNMPAATVRTGLLRHRLLRI